MEILNFEKFVLENRQAGKIMLYHGTTANFDKFDPSHINTGWGEQAYGYGFYFTDSLKTAEAYSRGGRIVKVLVPGKKYLDYKGIPKAEAFSIARKFFKYYTEENEYGKEAYPDKETKQMCWNEECKYIADSENGGDVYGTIASLLGDDKETSEFLNKIGYVGIKFECENGSTGEKFNNYLIFNADDIEIVK